MIYEMDMMGIEWIDFGAKPHYFFADLQSLFGDS